MRQTTRYALAVTTFAASLNLTNGAHAQEVVSSYVTFYGFDDNDDGNSANLGAGIISNTSIHGFANEDLGTYERPGTLATDESFLASGTKVYVPGRQRYYVMEDTCVECSEDWSQNKLHVDLYVSGNARSSGRIVRAAGFSRFR